MSALLDSSNCARTVGAKARVLRELADAGFPVPPFEVSPDDLAAVMLRLGSPLAVRSCAAVEDGRAASFAGLFRSLLNVRTLGELEEAIITCLGSRDSLEVREYLRRHHIDAQSIEMNVIVQQMIPAKLSGVAFSIDPLTGEDRVVIEACEGLGEQLLSGRGRPVAADHPRLCAWRPAIVNLAQSVQRHFGAPQDIEFAIDDHRLWLLQSRPITRIQYTADSGVWTNADFRDGGVSASVCSPLMWSLYRRAWHDSLIGFLREIRLLAPGEEFESARLFLGRPYWNLGAVKKCLATLPGFVERSFDRDLSVTPTYEGDGTVTPSTLRTVLRALPTAWKLRRFFIRQESAVRAFLGGGFEKLIQSHESRIGTGAEQLSALLTEDFWTTEILYFRTIFAASLAKLDLKEAFPEVDEVAFVGGLGPLRHLEPLARMRQLRQPATIEEDAIEQLLHQFRHHQPSGLDVIHPRWDEQRAYVQRLFAACHQAPAVCGTADIEDERRRQLARLPDRRRAAFARKLHRLRTFLFFREEMRDCSSRMYYLIRRSALAVAQERDLGNDIFFMSFDEILHDDRSGIASGHDVYERFRHLEAPNEIGGRASPSSMEPDPRNPGTIQGIAASRGRSRGIARIVRTADEGSRLERGVILVCPFVDPGWTCVLDRAVGVVTETGGLLSHAAVICREFGLPTVLGIQDATRRIRDGQMIEVDGDRGEVHLVSDQEP